MNASHACLLRLVFGATVLLAIDTPPDARAQGFPTRPITAITNVSPGGTYDIFMRALADGIRTVLGQPLIIEPRPGGNYMIAGRACSEAAPNGYTICALTGETLVIPEFMFKRVPYDSKRDFSAVMTLFFNTQVLVVNADLKVKSLEELAALAKARPRTLAYTAPTLFQRAFFERFNKQHGVDLVGVPFKGGGEAANLILSGTVPIGFFGGANFVPHVQSGRMIALAVDADKRSPLYPDTPTLSELGFTDKFSRPYLTLVVPAKTPPDIILTLHRAVANVMSQPDFRKRHLLDRGLEPIADTPEQATRFLAEDRDIVRNLVQELGLRPE
jgi:tripartite-type tricarboxylate transporter receptor subunit TctC